MKRLYGLCTVMSMIGALVPLSLSADMCTRSHWQSLFGGQAGIAVLTNAGQSVAFPATQIDQEESYTYRISQHIKVPALYGGYLGLAWSNKEEHDWGFSLTANYSQSSSFTVGGILTQGLTPSTSDTYDYSFDMRTRQLLGQVQFQYFGNEHVVPYFLAGLGAAFNQSNNFTTTVDPTLSLTRMYADNNSVPACTYAVGLGVDVSFCGYIHLGIGYKFSDLGKFSLGQAIIDTTPVSGTLSQENMYANEFLVQLTITF